MIPGPQEGHNVRSKTCLVFIVMVVSAAAGQPVRRTTVLPALTDPACPVTGYPPPFPVTKELRVLYLPMLHSAAIQKPKSLLLHVVFDDGSKPDAERERPFTRRDDGVWVATISLAHRSPRYATYWVEDPDGKQLDTNSGRYFEVPFCDLLGRRDESSVKYQAESFGGSLVKHGVQRPPDYAHAVDVLETFIHAPSSGGFLVSELWKFKLLLYGDTPEGRARLLSEINKFISDHARDGFGLPDTLNFVAYQAWVPTETQENLCRALEARPDYRMNPRVFLLLARWSLEKDQDKGRTILKELITKYPNDPQTDSAREWLFRKTPDFAGRQELYRWFQQQGSTDPVLPLEMAEACVKASRGLPEALRMLDEADKLQQAKVRGRLPHLVGVSLRVAMLRAEILLRLGKPGEALAVLKPRRKELASATQFYLLGQALEETGDRQAALDAYLEAVVRPSPDDRKYNAALAGLWSLEKLGSEVQLQQKIEAKLSQNFSRESYTPQIFTRPAPVFDLVTLKGEKLIGSQLRGKKVILDFWATWCAPCRAELGPLQDFQITHPDVTVLAVLNRQEREKDIKRTVRQYHLTRLRIVRAPEQLFVDFGVQGVPHIFVLDEQGSIRAQHLGDVPDLPRHLEADLQAIAAAKAPVR